nr:MAG: hypothetical protein DIU67_07245 [Actinomycetota bacterium]
MRASILRRAVLAGMIALLAVPAAALAGEPGEGADTPDGGPGGRYVEDHVVVRMSRGASIQALEADAEV